MRGPHHSDYFLTDEGVCSQLMNEFSFILDLKIYKKYKNHLISYSMFVAEQPVAEN